MPVTTLILAAVLAALAAPAAADCRAAIETVQQQTAMGDSKGSKPEGEGGEGTKPVESWFGSSSSKAAARDKLENARIMAEHGKEEGCMQLVQEVKRMMEDDPVEHKWTPPESAKAPAAKSPEGASQGAQSQGGKSQGGKSEAGR